MAAKVDWAKIEQEYVRGNMPAEALWTKYQIKQSTFEKHSAERNFLQKRKEYAKKVQEKALARACAREAKALARTMGAAEQAAKLLEKHMKDEDTLKNWLWTDKESGEVCEKRLKKLDTKAVREMAGALRDVVATLTMIQESREQAGGRQAAGGGVILLPERDGDLPAGQPAGKTNELAEEGG